MAWKKNWMKKKHWKVNPGFQPVDLGTRNLCGCLLKDNSSNQKN